MNNVDIIREAFDFAEKMEKNNKDFVNLKINQILMGESGLYALCNDGSLWEITEDKKWNEIPGPRR